MEYSAKIRELLVAEDNEKLQEWINDQSMLDQGNIWREVFRLRHTNDINTGVNFAHTVQQYDAFEKDIKILENNNLIHLWQKSLDDQARAKENTTDKNIFAAYASTRDYLIMHHLLKTENSELLKEIGLQVLKGERDGGVYNSRNWRGYDYYLEGKSLPEYITKSLHYRAKLLELIFDDYDDYAMENWIFLQPISEQIDILRELKDITLEAEIILGDDPCFERPDFDILDEKLNKVEAALLKEKQTEDEFKKSLETKDKAFKKLNKLESDILDAVAASRKRTIKAILDNTGNRKENIAYAKKLIAEEKKAGIYDPKNWGSVLNRIFRHK